MITNIEQILNSKYPLLLKQVKTHIDNSEKDFCDKNSQKFGGSLWEHTYNVASIASQLSNLERINPENSVIAALFHDAGKFNDGMYHDDDIREEFYAVEVAKKILNNFQISVKDKNEIYIAIDSLYNESNSEKSLISKIIHDADFLSKLGFLGVTTLFTKNGLRGNNLHKFIKESLSKELSYQYAATFTMQTKSGKDLARKKVDGSLKFYKNLLDELRDSNIAFYKVEEIKLKDFDVLFDMPNNNSNIGDAKIYLVVPEVCENCGSSLKFDFKTEKGIKCQKLISHIGCNKCDSTNEISICIPELVKEL